MADDLQNNSLYMASIYRLTGANFRMSAEILAKSLEMGEDMTPAKLTAIPMYFLVSHATELLLKSALLKRGFTTRELKNFDYRHNLDALLNALAQRGVSISENTTSLINRLHRQHQKHALRYEALVDNSETTFWCPPSILFEMLDELFLLTRIPN